MERGCYNVHRNESNPYDIVFSVKDGIGQVTENQQKLHMAVERTLVVVKKLYEKSPSELENYFLQLLTLAQAGTVPIENAQPTIAMSALEQLKMEIIDNKAGEIKNGYFKILGLKALYLGLPILIVALIIKIIYFYFNDEVITNLNIFSNYLWIWPSCMLGVWLSFGTRKTILTFEELTTIEDDRLEPTLRLIFVGALSVVFSLLFYLDAITIKFGSVSTSQLSNNAFTSIAFGVLLGLSEKVIGQKLSKKATSTFEKI